MNANIENPTDAHRAGKGGTGSSKGRTTNHEATGTRDISKILESGLGDSGGAMTCLPKFRYNVLVGKVPHWRRDLNTPMKTCRDQVSARERVALPFMATTSNSTSTSSGELCAKKSSCRSNWVLNREGCCIKTAEDKGRGVYGEQSSLDIRT